MGRSQNQETDKLINLRTTKLFFQPTMAEGEDIDLVEDIIITPFSRHTFKEKLDICKSELSNQGSNETPKYGWALTSNGAFQNFWGHPSGSTAQRTSAQGNGAAQ